MVEKKSSTNSSSFWLFLGALILINLLIWVRIGFRRGEGTLPPETMNGFNLSEPPKIETQPPAVVSPSTLSKDRLFRTDGPGLRGFVPEYRPRSSAGSARNARAVDPREKEMVAKYEREIMKYQEQLKDMIAKYEQRYPVVSQLGNDLHRSSDFWAFKRQYHQDRNPYAWARSTVQSAEIRGLAWKYMKKPQAWQVGFLMSLEALRTPPPKPIYDETRRFVTTDKDFQDFFTEFFSHIVQNIGQMSISTLPAGTDITPIYSLIRDLTTNPINQGFGLVPGATEQQRLTAETRSGVLTIQKKLGR